MKQVTTIGLDIAKSVFLVHGVDAAGGGSTAEIVPKPGAGVLRQTAEMPGWHRGVRLITLLGP